MASAQNWREFNSTNAASETGNRTECNWKSIDDSTTAYTSAPIVAGTNSFSKYQCLQFTGVWSSLSGFTYKISTATPNDSSAAGGNLTIKGAVVTSGTTPSTSATGDGNMSTSGLAANFVSNSTPYGAGTTSSTASGTMYVQCLRTQLVVGASCAPGDMASITITASWTES